MFIRLSVQRSLPLFIWFLVLCIISIFHPLQTLAEPVAWDGPGQKGWLTRSSQHFEVHYPSQNAEYDALALRALGIAEQAHEDLVPFFNTVPVHKTQLVVSDDQDMANGWASYFLFPQIRLYITPPSELSGLQNYGDWLTLLIRHEYVHILHMEMAAGLPEAGRTVLGRAPLLFPHSFTPPMMIEGLAVYFETDYEAGTGRLASTWYQMQMQEEVRSGNFNTLGEAVITSRDWPYGQYYLYGAFFVEYLAKTYGEETLKQWLQSYSREVLPWVMQNHEARKVFGKSFEALWRDYYEAMKVRFGGVVPERIGTQLDTAESVRLQVTAMAGDNFYVVERNDADRPVLNRCQGLQCETIAEADQIIALDVNVSGEVVAVQGVAYASGRYSGDVVVLENKHWCNITQGLRVSRVRWVPNSTDMIALSYKEGRAYLYRVAVSGDVTELWHGSYGEFLGDFAVSFDGKEVIAAYKEQGRAWNLARLDIASLNTDAQSWVLLTDTPATEASPRFAKKGKIIFVADYTGRYNVWALDNDSVEALTQVDSGVFEPWLSGDRLWVQEYQAQGFRIRNLPSEPNVNSTATKSVISDKEPPLNLELPTMSAVSDAYEYQPWKTVRPYFWLPYYEKTTQTSKFGFVTGGADALGRHYYQVQLGYGTEEQAVDANLLYRYDRWTFAYDLSHELIDVNPFDPSYTLLEYQDWLVERRWLYRALDDDFGLHAGSVYQSTKIISVEPGVDLVGDDSYTTLSYGLAATLDFQGGLLQSPGGFGSFTHLVVEDFSLSSNEVSGLHLQAGWSYLFDVPGRNTISLAVQGGVADEASPSWRLGGIPPQEDGSLFGRDQLSLRGYDAGVQFGDYYERERLSFHTQIAAVNNNWSIWPLGLDDIQLALFADRGRAWSDEQDAKALVGLGMEIKLNLLLGYRAPVPLILGGARGITGDEGKQQMYVRFQIPL